MRLIVADASPMIIIARSGLLPILTQMVDAVILPETVYAEGTFDLRLPGARAIKGAVSAGVIQVHPDAAPPAGDACLNIPALDAAIALACTLIYPLPLMSVTGAKRQNVLECQ